MVSTLQEVDGLAVGDAGSVPGVAAVVDEGSAHDCAVAVFDRVEHVGVGQVRELAVVALGGVADLVEFAGEFLAIGDDDIETAVRKTDAEDVRRLALARTHHLVEDEICKCTIRDEIEDRPLDDLALGGAEMRGDIVREQLANQSLRKSVAESGKNNKCLVFSRGDDAEIAESREVLHRWFVTEAFAEATGKLQDIAAETRRSCRTPMRGVVQDAQEKAAVEDIKNPQGPFVDLRRVRSAVTKVVVERRVVPSDAEIRERKERRRYDFGPCWNDKFVGCSRSENDAHSGRCEQVLNTGPQFANCGCTVGAVDQDAGETLVGEDVKVCEKVLRGEVAGDAQVGAGLAFGGLECTEGLTEKGGLAGLG